MTDTILKDTVTQTGDPLAEQGRVVDQDTTVLEQHRLHGGAVEMFTVEAGMSEEQKAKIIHLTIGKTEEEKSQVWEILGGEIDTNPAYQKTTQILDSMTTAIDTGGDIARLIQDLSPVDRGQITSLLTLTGAQEVFEELYGTDKVLHMYELLVQNQSVEDTNQALAHQAEVFSQLKDIIKDDDEGSLRTYNKALTDLCLLVISHNNYSNYQTEMDKIFSALAGGSEEIDYQVGLKILKYKGNWDKFYAESNEDLITRWIEDFSSDTDMLLAMRQTLIDHRGRALLIPQIDEHLFKETAAPEVDVETLAVILRSGKDFRVMARIASNWDKLEQPQRSRLELELDATIITLNQEERAKLAQEFAAAHATIPVQIADEIPGYSKEQRQAILINTASSGHYEEYQELFKTSQDIWGSLYNIFPNILEKSLQNDIEIPAALIDKISETAYSTQRAAELCLSKGGLEYIDALPDRFKQNLFSTPWDTDYSGSIMNLLIKHNQLDICPPAIQSALTINGETVAWEIKNNHHISAPWFRERMANVTITSQDQANILETALLKNDLAGIRRVGGEVLWKQCLNPELLNQGNINSLLQTCIYKVKWENVPPEIRALLKHFKPDSKKFNEITFLNMMATRDPELIASYAENANLHFVDGKWFYHLNNEGDEQYRGLLAGCVQEDVDRILQNTEFQTKYSEYFSLASQTISLGEQAFIVRSAYKGISLDQVNKMLSLARSQVIDYGHNSTNSTLTDIHNKGIYWEQWSNFTIPALRRDDTMGDYFKESNQKLFEPEELVSYIASCAFKTDSVSDESILWLLQHKPLVEGAELTQENYFQLYWYLARDQRDVSSKMLEQIGKQAGITTAQDFERLLQHEMNNYPTRISIEKISRLGNIDADAFKRIAVAAFATQEHIDIDVIKTAIKYVNGTNTEFSPAEKRQFWEAYKNLYSLHVIRLEDIEFFEKENVLTATDKQELAKEYCELLFDANSQYSSKLAAHLVPSAFTDVTEANTFLQHYSKDSSFIDIDVFSALYKSFQEKGFVTDQTQAAINTFFSRESMDFRQLTQFISLVGETTPVEVIKNGVINVAKRVGLSYELTDFLDMYEFTPQESRELLQAALENKTLKVNHSWSITSLRSVIEGCQFTSGEIQSYISQLLGDTAEPLDRAALAPFFEHLSHEEVVEIAKQYLIAAPSIYGPHMNELFGYLERDTPGVREQIWEEVKEAKPEYRFFDMTDLQKNSEPGNYITLTGGNNIFGVPSIESREPLSLQQDARVYYRDQLAYWENKQQLTPELVKKILGEDLHRELSDIKKAVAETIQSSNNLWFLNRARAVPSHVVAGHGTIQAVVENRATREEEQNLGYRSTVQAIVRGPDGIGIRGEKATLGSFFNYGVDGGYGGVEYGGIVLFFTDDLLESHVSITDDPAGGDGKVARDSETGRYLQVPNRVLLNPQAGNIEGVALSDAQMAEYILHLRWELSKRPDLMKQLEERGLVYEREKLGSSFVQETAAIHLQMRNSGYPEGAIVWARDFYTTLALSSERTSQEMFSCLKGVVQAVQHGEIASDIRGIMEDIRLTWDLGLSEVVAKGRLSPSEVVAQANRLTLSRQREAFLDAMNKLRDYQGNYIGVARQFMTQQEAAITSGDVKRLSLMESLSANRAIFMNVASDAEYETMLEHTSQLAERTNEIKRSVLRTTFNKAVAALPEEKREVYEKYRDRIAVCMSGSGGRGESVISSDLDYLIFFNDEQLEIEETVSILECLSILHTHVNQFLADDFFIRPDAGLGNKDAQPVVSLSGIKELTFDLLRRKQDVEPTEILDSIDISGAAQDIRLIQLFKTALIERNQELTTSPDVKATLEYVKRDMEKYDLLYNGGLSQFLSGDQLLDFKTQLQRIFNFKLYALTAEAFDEIEKRGLEIPGSTLGKIDLLAQLGKLTPEQQARMREQQIMFYRLRYREDVMTAAQTSTRGDARAKVIARFDPRSLTAIERTRMLQLFTEFNKI